MVAGSSSAGASSFDVAVARFEADGDVDNTFSGNGFELTEITDFDGARDVALSGTAGSSPPGSPTSVAPTISPSCATSRMACRTARSG